MVGGVMETMSFNVNVKSELIEVGFYDGVSYLWSLMIAVWYISVLKSAIVCMYMYVNVVKPC